MNVISESLNGQEINKQLHFGIRGIMSGIKEKNDFIGGLFKQAK
jgi:hypothetical protein